MTAPIPPSPRYCSDCCGANGSRRVFLRGRGGPTQYPALVAQAAADGHLIGNHSDRHGHGWAFASTQGIVAEFEAANRTFTEILGHAPRFARTPVGCIVSGFGQGVAPVCALATSLGTCAVWKGCTATRHASRLVIARRARNGSIILLHELYYGVRALRTPAGAGDRATDDRRAARARFSLRSSGSVTGATGERALAGRLGVVTRNRRAPGQRPRNESIMSDHIASTTSRAGRA
jgi:hypothetical protein